MFNEKIVPLPPNMSTFNELGLCNELLQAIEEQGYEHPMPVQEEVIPFLLNKEETADLVALAQTGTGKTAAYGLPILERLNASLLEAPQREKVLPTALILSPTRELCIQIADDMEGFSKYLPSLRILPVYGGANNAIINGNVTLKVTSGRFGQVFGGNNTTKLI